MCSKSLQETDVRETGRQLDALALSPFLNNGVACAVLQSSGIFPNLMDVWKMIVRAGVIAEDMHFRKWDEAGFIRVEVLKKLQHSRLCDSYVWCRLVTGFS